MIDNSKEYILCAAIHYRNGKIYTEQPKNIHDGIIISGHRHNNCIMTLMQLIGDRFEADRLERNHFGFITSHNRYVNRSEAFEIARKQDQIWHNLFDKKPSDIQINFGEDSEIPNTLGILTSEDLYFDLTFD